MGSEKFYHVCHHGPLKHRGRVEGERRPLILQKKADLGKLLELQQRNRKRSLGG